MQYLLCHSFQCYTFARFKFIDSNCFYVNLIKPRLGRILGIPLVHPSVPNIFSFSILNKGLMDHFMWLLNNFENWDVFNPQTFIYSAFNLICCSSKWPAKVFWKVATWKGVTLRIIVTNWRIFIQDILIIRSFEGSNPTHDFKILSSNDPSSNDPNFKNPLNQSSYLMVKLHFGTVSISVSDRKYKSPKM